MTIRTTDGMTSTDTVYVPKGAGLLGIAWSDIDAKYRTLAPYARLGDAQIETSLTLIHDFRHASRADALTELLRVPAKA